MNWFTRISRQLGWKLFLSYLIIVVVGLIVLDIAAELQVPRALERDMAHQFFMNDHPDLAASLEQNLQSAMNEILALGTLAAVIAAGAMSINTARRIVNPIQAMMRASQRIAAGDYHERVRVPSQDELGALAQSFNQMADALERTERRRLELIGNVAHELRTPLSSIKSTLEGLIDGVLPTEPETLLDLQREVARLQRLVHDLEELSRAEAGQIPLEIRAVSLADLVRSAADRLRPQFEDKGVAFTTRVPEDIHLKVDSARLTQVLLNLLGNALQYTPAEGTVHIRAWTHNTDALIAIQDTGIGIAPEHLPHIFERFYRVDKSRARAGGGSGIGLTIANHLVIAQGGRISVDSPGIGKGTTFTLTLPRVI